MEKEKETHRLEGQDHSAMGVRAQRRLAIVLQIGNKDADTDKDADKDTGAERLAPGHPVSQ